MTHLYADYNVGLCYSIYNSYVAFLLKLGFTYNKIQPCVPFCVSYTVALRLAGSSLDYEGRLEVYHNGKWGTICDQYGNFTADVASVACSELGFQ